MVAIIPLSDLVPGNIGLTLDDDTIVLLPFTEPEGVNPSDLAGTITDLTKPVSGNPPAPDSTVAWASAVTTHIREGLAYTGTDKTDQSSLLTRDVSVQAILAIDHTNGSGAANTWLVLRGQDPFNAAGATEYCSFGLRMQIDPTIALLGEVKIAWTWQNLSGTIFLDTYEVFTAPHAEIFLLTCTRRWVSSTSVVLRYYIGDRLLAERTVASGSIGGATTGSFKVGPSWFGWIDDLKVVSREMSHEEIKATWARLTRHQPEGVTALIGQSPPGAIWARQDGSDVGRLIKAAGEALGYAAGKAHELRETFLPDRAYRDTIARWEGLVGLQQREQRALDDRRQRVVERLQVENGYSPSKVQAILASSFDVPAVDVNIIEFSPTITDDFAGAGPAAVNGERWRDEPPSAWSITSNALLLEADVGQDLRFDPASVLAPHHCRLPIDDNEEGFIVQVKLATYWAALPDTVSVGLFLYNRVTNDSLWFGVKNDGGTRKVGWVALKDGVLGTFQVISTPSVDAAYYLRIEWRAAGNYLLYWSSASFTSGTTVLALGTVTNIEYVGVAAMATDGTLDIALAATFDDFLARVPNGERAFHWYAHRDPGDPGSPDMEAAHALVQKIKPAHTDAAAVLSLSLLCDNDTGLCDHTPLGGV